MSPTSIKVFLTVLNYRTDTIFNRKISKGHYSVKNVSGVTVFFPAHCLMVAYICTKFQENILDGIKVIEWTQFLYEKIQRGIIP